VRFFASLSAACFRPVVFRAAIVRAGTRSASGWFSRCGFAQIIGERMPNVSGFEVLSKSSPMELRNYPFRILAGVRNKWYPQIMDLKKSANWKRASTVVEFEINRDGSMGDLRTIESTGDASLAAAACQAISSAAPFPILPDTYPGHTLRFRYHFGYDQPATPEAPMCNGPNLGAHPADYVVRKVGNGIVASHLFSGPRIFRGSPQNEVSKQGEIGRDRGPGRHVHRSLRFSASWPRFG